MGLQMLLLMLSSLSPCGKGKSKKEKKVQVTRKITHAKTKPNKSYKFFWTLEKKKPCPSFLHGFILYFSQDTNTSSAIDLTFIFNGAIFFSSFAAIRLCSHIRFSRRNLNGTRISRRGIFVRTVVHWSLRNNAVDFSQNVVEGSFNISTIQRGCLNKRQAMTLGKSAGFIRRNRTQVSQIRFVSHQHYDNVLVSMITQFLQPPLNIFIS